VEDAEQTHPQKDRCGSNMRPVIYEDKKGYLHRVMVKDDDPDSAAKYGIPDGPPSLEDIDWSEMKREIHNALVRHGAFTWQEAQKNNGVALQAAISIFKRYLIHLYRKPEI